MIDCKRSQRKEKKLYLSIFNGMFFPSFWTRGSTFSSFTEPHKLCGQLCVDWALLKHKGHEALEILKQNFPNLIMHKDFLEIFISSSHTHQILWLGSGGPQICILQASPTILLPLVHRPHLETYCALRSIDSEARQTRVCILASPLTSKELTYISKPWFAHL